LKPANIFLSVNRHGVIAPKVLDFGISKITDDGEPDPAKLQSFFGPKADEIVRMLEDKDTDGAVSMIGRTLLATVVNILPILEQNVQQSRCTKGAYQFNQTVSSIRELLADLQAAQDRGEIGHRIVERFIRPAFQDIGAQIVTGFAEIEAQAKNRMSDSEYQEFRKDTLEIIKRNLATYIRDVYEEQKKAVVQSLT
jgi:hypothetical protein